MKIGVRAHDLGQYDENTLAAKLAEARFNAAQVAVPKAITGVSSYLELSEEAAGRIKTAFEKYKVEITVLGCYIDISNPDQSIWENHQNQFFAALECARTAKACMVGTESSYGIVSMEEKVKTWDSFLKRMDVLVNQAERVGVNVGIEPVAVHTLYSPEWTRKLLDTIDSNRLQVIFDPINMLVPERAGEQELVWKECVSAFGKEVEAIHLKGFYYDDQNQYVPCELTKGIADYRWLFQWLKEQKPDIAILREELNPVFAEEDVAYIRQLIR